MKLRVFIFKAPFRVVRIQRRRSVYRFKRQMLTLKIALSQEKQETKEMLAIYKKYTRRQASPDEMNMANKQFIDLLKGLGLGVFAVLPFAPITIPVMIKLSRLVGVEILPSSFSSENKIKKQSNRI
ncbi:hypothetical protein RI844_12690 [Thalassotalea fonticola]|uniref:Letm1 RBD domain-containing protein n=1 Tax=Thalassotalea fonticola TaxID=3065649 RepID=A0ABZ0GKD5_9GAMM|nr:hypothetical protein RI844_12690 [Colwelliaceae bacterium S1-1]